ncbi:MAG: hypothetical protein AAFV53_21345 [Myxococcota bacterium]
MSRSQKVALGLLTHWPILYMVVFVSFWLASFFAMQSGGDAIVGMMAVIFPLHALTMLVTMGLWLFYIVHTVQNTRLTDNDRLVWIIVHATVGMIGWIAYFWMRIVPAPLTVD